MVKISKNILFSVFTNLDANKTATNTWAALLIFVPERKAEWHNN